MSDETLSDRPQSGDVLTISQTRDPQSVQNALLTSAIREGWIALLVNVNAAVFFGIILLAAGIDATDTLGFLVIQILATSLAVILWFFLLTRSNEEIESRAPLMRHLVQLGDAMIMAGWGCAMPLIYDTLEYERTALLVILLMAAGIASSALSAKLVRVLIGGRAILFLPSFIYLIWLQPPLWGIHSGMLIFAFSFSIGVGYAVHVQHLRVASLNIDLKEAGQELAQSLQNEKLSAQVNLREAALRERFLRSVTHDLRQPLNALKLFVDDLSRGELDKRGQEDVAASMRCLRSANAIIESVSQLTWVNNKTPVAAPVHIPILPILRQVADEIEPQAWEKLVSVRLVESSAWCVADPHFLERILRNLAHNALQYTDEGRILIGVRLRPYGDIEVWFCDTGKGIPADDMSKIFHAYQRGSENDQSGSGNIGLGLTIVRELANAMGGAVSVSSEFGRGSIFRLRIPGALRPAEESRKGQDGTIRLDGRKILVVDDDHAFMSALSDDLRKYGAEVAGISRQDGIRALLTQKAPAHDAAILDFDLGAELTAFDLLDAANGLEAEKTIIATANADIARMHLQEFAGIRILSKPLVTKRLHYLLDQVLSNTPRS